MEKEQIKQKIKEKYKIATSVFVVKHFSNEGIGNVISTNKEVFLICGRGIENTELGTLGTKIKESNISIEKSLLLNVLK
jgi:hypothetical protein